jgi:diadenylate cyclase
MLTYIGPTDVLDIVATSILIYYVLLLMRGTRAVQILIGVLVLVALLAIANVLRLYLLGSILQVLVVGAAVTLPIVFQPELRRALEQIGRGGLFRIAAEPSEGHGRAEDRSVAAIAKTAFLLSRARCGALIVIEQLSGLKEFAETGTALDAKISPELLLAIFSTRSPLHDGAAIVRDDVIEAAGCFLPLAEHSLAQERLGTRHRAALGLSEQTDAVVVAVSEETGAIRVAREGKLTRPIEDELRLRKVLLAVTRPPRMRRPVPNDLVAHLRARLLPNRPRSGDTRGDTPKELRT